MTIRRRLAEVNRTAYLPDLANSLRAYGWVCVNLNDDLPAALDSVNEAIRLYLPLTERLPHIFMRQLFAAYQTLADVLKGLGHADEADVRRHLDQDPCEPQVRFAWFHPTKGPSFEGHRRPVETIVQVAGMDVESDQRRLDPREAAPLPVSVPPLRIRSNTVSPLPSPPTAWLR